MKKFLKGLLIIVILMFNSNKAQTFENSSCCESPCYITTASLFSLSRLAGPFLAGFSNVSQQLATASVALNAINVVSSLAEQIIPCCCASNGGCSCGTSFLAPLACIGALSVSALQLLNYSEIDATHPLYIANVALSTISLGVTVLRYRFQTDPNMTEHRRGLYLGFPLEGYQSSTLGAIPCNTQVYIECNSTTTVSFGRGGDFYDRIGD